MHRRRQHTSLPRQIRHLFLIVVGRGLLPARDGARRTRRGIRKDIADLRTRRRCNRGEGGDQERRTTGYDNGSKHLARLYGSNQDRGIVQI